MYDMCCSCRRRSSELLESNDDSDDEENQTSPLLRLEEERIESSSSEVEEVIGSGKILIKRKNKYFNEIIMRPYVHRSERRRRGAYKYYASNCNCYMHLFLLPANIAGSPNM